MDGYTATIISLSIIFLSTGLGALGVFFLKKKISEKSNNAIMGFASGVMIAAAFFGLLMPAIDNMNELATYANWGAGKITPIVGGFILGGLLLFGLDRIIPHIHVAGGDRRHEEGPVARKVSKSAKFFLAVTLHNIPEGLAVGFACGLVFQAVNSGASPAEITAMSMSVVGLAIGIGLQNIPEGFAVAVPLVQDEGFSKKKAFGFGVLSGIVEPIFAVIALFLAQSIDWLMPWLLSFAAGAMFYAVIEDLMPDFQKSEDSHYGIWAFMIGFAIMMVLEIILV